MPKGVYDRSKTRRKTTAAKTAKAPKTKKASRKNVVRAAPVVRASIASVENFSILRDNLHLLEQLQQNPATTPDLSSHIIGEMHCHLATLTGLRRKLFGIAAGEITAAPEPETTARPNGTSTVVEIPSQGAATYQPLS